MNRLDHFEGVSALAQAEFAKNNPIEQTRLQSMRIITDALKIRP